MIKYINKLYTCIGNLYLILYLSLNLPFMKMHIARFSDNWLLQNYLYGDFFMVYDTILYTLVIGFDGKYDIRYKSTTLQI